jgi:putative transposase
VQEGLSPHRRETKPDVVGLDIGPSNIAAVGQTDAIFEQFCPSVVQPWKELRRIERAMDRSKWANNPECFDDKGRWKKNAQESPVRLELGQQVFDQGIGSAERRHEPRSER